MSTFIKTPEWTILELADQSLAFVRSDGHNVRVASPPERLGALLDALDGQPLAEAMAQIGVEPGSECGIELASAVDQLAQRGVLLARAALSRPPWVCDSLFERMAPFAERLDGWVAIERLRSASVMMLGAGGGVGSGAAMLLAAAGIGTLVLVDADIVEPSNLTRQIFFDTADIGQPKVEALRRRIEAFTPFTAVRTVPSTIGSASDAIEHLRMHAVDMVLNCADFPAVHLARWLAEACVATDVPYLGVLQGSIGPLLVPGQTACRGCEEQADREVHPHYDAMMDALAAAKPKRRPSSPLGVLSAATVQAREAIGFITGAWTPRTLRGRVDLHGSDRLVQIERHPQCPICGPDVLARTG